MSPEQLNEGSVVVKKKGKKKEEKPDITSPTTLQTCMSTGATRSAEGGRGWAISISTLEETAGEKVLIMPNGHTTNSCRAGTRVDHGRRDTKRGTRPDHGGMIVSVLVGVKWERNGLVATAIE